MYVIWSFEHSAWWAPHEQGYTRDLAAAGRYNQADAGRIVTDSVLLEEIAILEQVIAQYGGKPPKYHPYEGEVKP